MRTIVLTGGGTAGHVLPNMALLPFLRTYFDKIYYLGGNGIEKNIAKEYGIEFYEITTVKFQRKITLKNLAIPFKLWRGIRAAKQILKKLHPDVVFSKGGFVALPVVLAAASLKIKIIAHESDMSIGLTNRLTMKKCTYLCSTFPLKLRATNYVQTGAIIRAELYHGDRQKITLPVNQKLNLLIMGGSLGAVAINQVIWANLTTLCTHYNVLHLTGVGKANFLYQHNGYLQLEYLKNPENAFAWADIVMARAGSGTVSELLALGKPALYVPLPKSASRGDQIQNAAFMEQLGVCQVIPQEQLTGESLLQTLQLIQQHRAQIIQQCRKQKWIDGTAKIINYLQ